MSKLMMYIKTHKKGRKIAVAVFCLCLIVTCIGVVMARVRAEGSVSITYTDGQYYKYEAGDVLTDTGLFDDFEIENVPREVSNCIILPGDTFAQNITRGHGSLNITGSAQLDSETFYFDELGEGQSYSDLWAYTFTGWMIAGASEKIPGETVFQPGDMITPDIIDLYADENNNITLEALWGRCYFVRNPYKTMVYSQCLPDAKNNLLWGVDAAESEAIPDNVTGADDGNQGNDPALPKASVVGVYTLLRAYLSGTDNPDAYNNINNNPMSYDAFATVVMLTGDLDYCVDNTVHFYTTANSRSQNFYGYSLLDQGVKNGSIGFVSATYKSLLVNEDGIMDDTVTHDYMYKPKGYYNQIYGSLRFDNINIISPQNMHLKDHEGLHNGFPSSYNNGKVEKYQSIGSEFELMRNDNHTGICYFETTVRYNSDVAGHTHAITTLRPSQYDYVYLRGGKFGTLSTNWSTKVVSGRTLHWTVARKTNITSSIACGTGSAYETSLQTVNNKFEIKLLGGTIASFAGGMNGMYTHCIGDRNIEVYGDRSSSTEYNPKITNFYGGGFTSRLFGDISIKVNGCTNIQNLYGGGRDFTATVFGDIDIDIKNSVINGQLFGGGYNGDCKKSGNTFVEYYSNAEKGGITDSRDSDFSILPGAEDRANLGGNVTIRVENSTLKKGLFGSGQGSSSVLTVTETRNISSWYADKNVQVYPTEDMAEGWDWSKPVNDYPSYDRDLEFIYIKGYRDLSWTDLSPTNLAYQLVRSRASLSVATVQNVLIDLSDSTVTGDVYGGGSIAKVLGDVVINIKNTSITGNVFGGGDGDAPLPFVQMYRVLSESVYSAPKYNIDSYDSADQYPKKVTITKQKPAGADVPKGDMYQWTNDISVLNDHDGIDHERKLLYSPNASGFGNVLGNIVVNIENSTVTKSVYGGGNHGNVDGSTTVNIKGDDTVIGANVFGGANGDAEATDTSEKGVVGTSTLNIYSGTVNGYAYGGCNMGDVLGDSTLNISGGDIFGAFGGSNSADIGGSVELNISGGSIDEIYGANNQKGMIDGSVNVLMTDGDVQRLYGGGNRAAYNGTLETLIEGGTVTDTAYGGSNMADVGGDVNITITGGSVYNCFGGNNESGSINGAINTTLDGGRIEKHLFGGGNKANYAGITNLVIKSGNVGDFGTPQEVPNESVDSCAFGGGYEATVAGTNITVSGGEIRAIVGGSYKADIIPASEAQLDAVTVHITGENPTRITTFMGGNDMGGDIRGNIRIVIGTTPENLFLDSTGGDPDMKVIDYDSACPNGNIVITNLFGGGNAAHYSHGSDWLIPEVNPGKDYMIPDYSGITITVLAGDIYQMFGGGVMADVSNVRLAVYGGEYNFIYGGGFMGYTRTTVTNLRGGNISGKFLVENQSDLPSAEQGGYVFGGGYNGYTAVAIVNIEELEAAHKTITVGHSVFAGGNGQHAGTGYSKITMLAGTVIGSLYGGGYSAGAGVDKAGNLAEYACETDGVTPIRDVNGNPRTASAVVELSGGNVGMETQLGETGRTYVGNVYGGGYKGITNESHVDIMSYDNDVNITLHLGGNIYGGGHAGDIAKDARVHYFKGKVAGNVYGGGREGNVYGSTYVYMLAGELAGSLYGGGFNGTANDTFVAVSDKISAANDYGFDSIQQIIDALGLTNSDLLTTIKGNVFGGGEGETATVYNSTEVRINLENIMQDTSPIGEGGAGGSISYIQGNVFGGGNLGTVGDDGVTQGTTNVIIKDGHIKGSVYAGGNGVPETGGDSKDSMGAVYGVANLNLYGGQIDGNAFGGGLKGSADETHIDIMAMYRHEISDKLRIGGNIFGGGQDGHVVKNTLIHFFTGEVNGNIYGGGMNGDVGEHSSVYMMAGVLNGSMYGGGLNGKVGMTHILITDKTDVALALGINEVAEIIETFELTDDDIIVTIEKNVFGGGEGESATVKTSTHVIIDLDYEFSAVETPITTTSKSNVTSGQIVTTVTGPVYAHSHINGNVYGGGDLGSVGEGRIFTMTNTASVVTKGISKVTLRDGHIKGSVFGGGNGVPPAGTNYSANMGAVFGSTVTNIYGGSIGGNVYGGGTQSRVYGDGEIDASMVNIDECNAEGYGKGIVIGSLDDNGLPVGGSIFGGGDRGNGVATNATVPTTIGDVKVNIIGNPNGASKIYFVGSGGVYGDGNFCLVKGERVVTVRDLTTGESEEDGTPILKTFYSLQRADKVHLYNTEVVLLGAIDLVEEGDDTLYSINRVNHLYLNEGSTIKLDQIVKALANIYSDVHRDREFIFNGNNGKNNYGDTAPSAPLGGSEFDAEREKAEIEDYRNESDQYENVEKNVVCVANGKYLTISDDSDVYGEVSGLFTLELLFAVPGEGGGFVYADISKSTGDFICETAKGFVYEAKTDLTQAQFESGEYYIRVLGEGYVPADTFQNGTLYYTRTVSAGFMDVVDDIGGHNNGNYTYYYWYINGPTITYNGDITGYIGSSETEFPWENTVPQHAENLGYVLFGITGNDKIEQLLISGQYELVQKKSDLADQEISFELVLGSISLGYLTYENGTWGILKEGAAESITGYLGSTGNIPLNKIVTDLVVNNTNDKVQIILHKATSVDAENSGMSFVIEMDLVDENDNIYAEGTSTLVFNMNINIVRLLPEQSVFTENGKVFSGAPTIQTIQITGQSSFTMEYQTKYIPGAFIYDLDKGLTMSWLLSTKGYVYYWEKDGSNFLTLDSQGNVINSSLTYSGTDMDSSYEIYKDDTATDPNMVYYYYRTDPEDPDLKEKIYFVKESQVNETVFPAGLKITMIDYSVDADYPEYYYFINESECQIIDILSFMVMGTKDKISELPSSERPDFVRVYLENKTIRTLEHLIFVFDYSSVDWSEEPRFDGTVGLRHEYGDPQSSATQTEIMDHVKSKVNEDTVTYDRWYPASTEFAIDGDLTGLIDISAVFDKEAYYDKGEASFSVSFNVDESWINTLLKEGQYSLMISLVDKDGNVLTMPTGLSFEFSGEDYYPGINREYAIIPIVADSVHTVKIKNTLYSLKEIVGDTAYFHITLCSSPDANYYDSLVEARLGSTISYEIVDNPIYSVGVDLIGDTQIFEKGDTISLAMSPTVEQTELFGEEEVHITLEARGEKGEGYTSSELSVLFEGDVSGILSAEYQEIELVLKSMAQSGSYRLKFRYGDRTEYWYFIVK